ncbi:MAG: alpha/beta fold hydrolase [Rhodoferax sp.]|nr:alpha/beta fold hydrolase [Rhodoferax sp.]
MKVQANGIQIEVEDSASAEASHQQRPVVLLIMGLGLQLVAWPEAFVQGLLDAGYRVVRFDNRDIGLSTAMDHLGKPKVAWSMIRFHMGLGFRPPYGLVDMAADALGVLDALGIARVHLVGVSMGGMVAQRVAIAAPQRVLSLTSIMSSSGAKGLPGPRHDVLKLMMKRPKGSNEEAVVQHTLRLFQAVGSPAFPIPAEEAAQRIRQAFRRSYRPVGTLRQMLAVVADGERAALLARITSPTLVLHGRADPLVPFACAEDTARRIPGATLFGIEGMGHDLPAQAVQHLLAALQPHLLAAQLRTATSV